MIRNNSPQQNETTRVQHGQRANTSVLNSEQVSSGKKEGTNVLTHAEGDRRDKIPSTPAHLDKEETYESIKPFLFWAWTISMVGLLLMNALSAGWFAFLLIIGWIGVLFGKNMYNIIKRLKR